MFGCVEEDNIVVDATAAALGGEGNDDNLRHNDILESSIIKELLAGQGGATLGTAFLGTGWARPMM
eukprot:scaffold8855_cov82-Skeletonema_menzelii.AAC.1